MGAPLIRDRVGYTDPGTREGRPQLANVARLPVVYTLEHDLPNPPVMLLDFDQHATTPLAPRVLEAMLPFFGERGGNPSSISHRQGLAAAQVEAECRDRVSAIFGVEPREIIWTSGATEANNLAIKGTLLGAGQGRKMVTSASEHRSVLDPSRKLARRGHPIVILSVNRRGVVDIVDLEKAITPDTALVSMMWANNEIGSIADMTSIAAVCQQRGVCLHTDATQAVGKIPIYLKQLDVNLLSCSAHKFYGPPGIGVLIVRRSDERAPLLPQVDGGGQQRGLRGGTLPLPLIVGLTRALELCEQSRVETAARLSVLRDRLWNELSHRLPGVVRHTPEDTVLAHTLNIGIPGIDGDALLAALQNSDLCVSSGSACSSTNREPSHVLTAIGIPDTLARASLRFGLGPDHTEDHILRAVEILSSIVQHLRGNSR